MRSFFRVPLVFLLVCITCLLFPRLSMAQETPVQATLTFHYKVVEANGARFRVIDNNGTRLHVDAQTSSADLQRTLEALITGMAQEKSTTDPTVRLQWTLYANDALDSSSDFVEEIKQRIQHYEPQSEQPSSNLTVVPVEDSGTGTITFTFLQRQIASLAILATTATENQNPGNVTTQKQRLGEAYALLPAAMKRALGSLTQSERDVSLELSLPVQADALLTSQPQDAAFEQLRLVAVRAFLVARQSGILPGNLSRIPSSRSATNLGNAIVAAYKQPTPTPQVFLASQDPSIGTLAYVIKISGVPLLADVSIHAQWNTDVTGDNEALRLSVENALNRVFIPRLRTRRGNPALTDEVTKDVQWLNCFAHIASASDESLDADLKQKFTVVLHNPNDYREDLWLTGLFGTGYSAERRWTGKFGTKLTNLLRQDNTFDFALDAGEEAQTATINLVVPYIEPWRRQFRALFSITGQYDHDNHQLLGNTLANSTQERETSLKTRFQWEFSPSPLDCEDMTPPVRYHLTSFLQLEYGGVDVRQNDVIQSAARVANGQITTFTASMLHVLDHVPMKSEGAWGHRLLALETTWNQGIDALGGIYHYSQLSANLEGLVYLNTHVAKAFLARYKHGLGLGSGGTPLFRLFRLGGPQAIRGLEDGELLGRNISYDRFEFGISTPQIARWITPGRKNDQVKLGPYDLSNAYVKFFYDAGGAQGRGNLSDLFRFSHTAEGYGIAFELQQLPGASSAGPALTLGYAYSPNSQRHRGGLFLIGVDTRF